MTDITLRGGQTTTDRRLDRLVSETDEHLVKYPLTAATLPEKPASMVMGANWYSNFDRPILRRINGRNYWVIGDGDLGSRRGGHSTCLRNYEIKDVRGWWLYYDQGVEGRCVEFATSRMMSQLNRKRYDITSRWLYWNCQMEDEWQGGSYPGATPIYEGTSVRAALEIARTRGMLLARSRARAITFEEALALVKPEEGIQVYRWARDWADVRAALRVPSWYPGVPLNNSWGEGYPREVILLDNAGARILAEDGEFGVVTDR